MTFLYILIGNNHPMKRQGAEVYMVQFPFVVDRREENISVHLLINTDPEEMGNTGCLWKGNQEVGARGGRGLSTVCPFVYFEF